MCVIVNAAPGLDITWDIMQRAIERNGHGWGIAVRYENGEMRRAYGQSATSAWRKWKSYKGGHRVFHARIATHGTLEQYNLHPFPCPAPNGEMRYLMHNGTLGVPILDKKYSDTWHFARMLEAHNTSKELLDEMNTFASRNASRFVFMLQNGHVWRMGGGWIITPDGVEYSNGSALGEKLSGYGIKREWEGGLLEVPGTRCNTFHTGFDYDKALDMWVVRERKPLPTGAVARPTESKWPGYDEDYWDETRYSGGPYGHNRHGAGAGYRGDSEGTTFGNGIFWQGKLDCKSYAEYETKKAEARSAYYAARNASPGAVASGPNANRNMRGIFPNVGKPGNDWPKGMYRWADVLGQWWEYHKGPDGKWEGQMLVDGPHPGTVYNWGPIEDNGWCLVFDQDDTQIGYIDFFAYKATTVSRVKRLVAVGLIAVTAGTLPSDVDGVTPHADLSGDGGNDGPTDLQAKSGEGTPETLDSTSGEGILEGETPAEWEARVAKEVSDTTEYIRPVSVRDFDPDFDMDGDAISYEELCELAESKGIPVQQLAHYLKLEIVSGD